MTTPLNITVIRIYDNNTLVHREEVLSVSEEVRNAMARLNKEYPNPSLRWVIKSC